MVVLDQHQQFSGRLCHLNDAVGINDPKIFQGKISPSLSYCISGSD